MLPSVVSPSTLLPARVQPHHLVLDMCAAPGSKTAQLLEALAADGAACPKVREDTPSYTHLHTPSYTHPLHTPSYIRLTRLRYTPLHTVTLHYTPLHSITHRYTHVQEEFATFMDCLREPLPATFRLNDNGPFTDVLRRRLETEFDFGVLEVEGKQVQPPKRLAWYVNRFIES